MTTPKTYQASAPGKVILFGEHAVVHGRPAIAVPVTQVQATVRVYQDAESKPGGRIISPQVGLDTRIGALGAGFWAAALVREICKTAGLPDDLLFTLIVDSSIPVASGLGSGAAVAVAAIRALAAFLGLNLKDEQVNRMAYEIEKIHHGTPSGIDNTVVTYARPVYFVRGRPPETLRVGKSFTLIIADTGIPSPTSKAVADVRAGWLKDPQTYDTIFDRAGAITEQARTAIESGEPERLGKLMTENHGLLQAMGVSSPELDHLIGAAMRSGAAGAKLSGGGRGGNLIAAPGNQPAEQIASDLHAAGAVRTIVTEIQPGRTESGG